MNEEMTQQLAATADRLANAAEALDRVLGKLDAQQEALNAKVDRIVAAVEERSSRTENGIEEDDDDAKWKERVAELEKCNHELKAQAARLARKTLSPTVAALIGKEIDGGDKLDLTVLDKVLQPLSVEQRIAVKAEMARAGLIG